MYFLNKQLKFSNNEDSIYFTLLSATLLCTAVRYSFILHSFMSLANIQNTRISLANRQNLHLHFKHSILILSNWTQVRNLQGNSRATSKRRN